jgi:putative acetyltransferase
MNEISIRPVTPADHRAIRELIVNVFHETYDTGEEEATLVEQLRECLEPGENISLIAEHGEKLVGQIFFSAVKFKNHPEIPACVLGPLGIHQRYQKQGIGTQLAQEGLKECAHLGYKVVVVQGSLAYYSRFGFIPIEGTGLHTIFNSEHDMVLELEKGLLSKISGLVDFPAPWHALV